MLENTRRAVAHAGARLLRVRAVVRAPIWLYRARLGAVFGRRLLMLVHTGRSSGLERYVVLEVVDHPSPHRYVVVSGFGEQAQWFRNIRATPAVEVQVGSHRRSPATARPMNEDEAAASLRTYASRHPRSWDNLRPILERTLGAPLDESGSGLPVVALDLASQD